MSGLGAIASKGALFRRPAVALFRSERMDAEIDPFRTVLLGQAPLPSHLAVGPMGDRATPPHVPPHLPLDRAGGAECFFDLLESRIVR